MWVLLLGSAERDVPAEIVVAAATPASAVRTAAPVRHADPDSSRRD